MTKILTAQDVRETVIDILKTEMEVARIGSEMDGEEEQAAHANDRAAVELFLKFFDQEWVQNNLNRVVEEHQRHVTEDFGLETLSRDTIQRLYNNILSRPDGRRREQLSFIHAHVYRGITLRGSYAYDLNGHGSDAGYRVYVRIDPADGLPRLETEEDDFAQARKPLPVPPAGPTFDQPVSELMKWWESFRQKWKS